MRDRVEGAGRFGDETRPFTRLNTTPTDVGTTNRMCGDIVEAGIVDALCIFATGSSKSTRFSEDATPAAGGAAATDWGLAEIVPVVDVRPDRGGSTLGDDEWRRWLRRRGFSRGTSASTPSADRSLVPRVL
jgi:hypothetical protein